MPDNGSGVFSLIYNWINDAAANINIRADRMMTQESDIATALTNRITKNGQTTPTANLPMGSNRHLNVGDAQARNQYASYGQVQDGVVNWAAGGGTADAITANYNPAVSTLVDGQLFFVKATAANATTTPTFSPNGLTARTITKLGNQALAPGDIYGAGHELIFRYRQSDTKYELLNPAVTGVPSLSGNNTFTGSNTFSGSSVFSGAVAVNGIATMGAALNEKKGTDIASATTTDIGVATGNFVHITGTTTITGLGTIQAGTRRVVTFDGILTLTHNATSLILPTAANITTAAGDSAVFVSEGSGNWRCVSYQRASGAALVSTIITPWVPYTPTITGVVGLSGVSYVSRRVGDTLEIIGKSAHTNGNGSPFLVELGFNGVSGGLTIDTAKLPTGVAVIGTVGLSVGSTSMFHAVSNGGASVGYSPQNTGVNTPNPVTSAFTLYMDCKVPIQGW